MNSSDQEAAEKYASDHVENAYRCCEECGHHAADRKEWVKKAYNDGLAHKDAQIAELKQDVDDLQALYDISKKLYNDLLEADQSAQIAELREHLRKTILWAESMYGKWVSNTDRDANPVNWTTLEAARQALAATQNISHSKQNPALRGLI